MREGCWRCIFSSSLSTVAFPLHHHHPQSNLLLNSPSSPVPSYDQTNKQQLSAVPATPQLCPLVATSNPHRSIHTVQLDNTTGRSKHGEKETTALLIILFIQTHNSTKHNHPINIPKQPPSFPKRASIHYLHNHLPNRRRLPFASSN